MNRLNSLDGSGCCLNVSLALETASTYRHVELQMLLHRIVKGASARMALIEDVNERNLGSGSNIVGVREGGWETVVGVVAGP